MKTASVSVRTLSYLTLFSLLGSIILPLVPAGTAYAVNDTKEVPFLARSGPFDLSAPGTDATGGASYSIPVVTPPGRNGIQPSLSLAYSSNNTDNTSVFGYGFDVPIPKISRLNKEGMEKLYAQSDFTSSLDGELVFLSGTTIKTFAPKYESGAFNTYTFDTTTNKWTVTDKSGTVFSFGTTASSRQDNPANTAQIYAWNLDRVEDTNGNFMLYTYFKDAGQVYPDKVTYTANAGVVAQFEVSFIREARADIVPSYRTGFSVKSNFRIKQILVKAMGVWVRKYDLAYSTGANGVRSVLSSVTESGRDANGNVATLPATLLEYQTPTVAFTQASWNLPTQLVDNAFEGDNGSRFIDVNGDGLVDILKSKSTDTATCAPQLWLNNGAGWTQNTSYTYAPSTCFVVAQPGYYDFGLRAADINGDGKDDLIHAFQEANNNNITTYKRGIINSGTAFAHNTSVLVPNTFQFAGWYGGTSAFAPLDVNGDGRADLLMDGTSFFLGGNGTAQGWSTLSNPAGSATSGGNFQIADLNGDGIPDTMAWYQVVSGGTTTDYKTVTLGDGSKFVSSTLLPPTAMADNTGVDYGVRLGDINGDGLTDVVKSHHFYSGTYQVTNALWVNTGVGFQSSSITLPSDVNFSLYNTSIGYRDSGWRMLDVNGDGMLDIVGSKPNDYPQQGVQYSRVYLNTSTKADLLKKVTIPQGGTTQYTYKTSLQYKDGSNNLVNTQAPYPVTVVDTVTTSDGTTNDTKSYFYEGAFQYFAAYNDKQFGGFSAITETDATGAKTKTYYHQGNTTNTALGEVADHPSKIGRIYRTERYNPGGALMQAQVSSWDSTALTSGRFLVTKSRDTTLTYKGDSTHKDTATMYLYDTNGNMTERKEYGEVTANNDGTFTDVGTDLRTTQYTYATDAAGKVRNKTSQEQLNDNTGSLVAQTQYLYDSLVFGSVTLGNTTGVKKYTGPATYATTSYTYSPQGQVLTTTNPRGNTTTLVYDSYKLYPTTETNALSQVTTRTWDYALGKEKTVTDANSQVTQTDYDGLGRVTAVSATDPYTFSLTPLSQTTYFDYRNAFSSYSQQFINSSLSQDTYTYFDPLGRKVQTRTSHENGNFAVADTVYTRDNLVLKQSLPYYSTGSAKTPPTSNTNLYTTFGYDSLNRVTSSANVLGTTTTAYGDWSRTTTDPLGNKKDVFTDAFGNIAKVNEYPTPTAVPTTYQYNAQNLLTKITDGAGNIRNFTYGPRGERTLAEDLHGSGDTTFAQTTNTYDDNGNVLTETRGGSTTSYAYDQLDRMLTEDSDTTTLVDVAYTYDDIAQTANGKGRLTKTRRLVDSTNSNWSYFYYLRNGLVYQDSKSIQGGGSFLTKYTYDTAGNVTKLTTPDNAEVVYTYNSLNKVEKITRKEAGDATYTPVVFNFDYGPHGNVVTKSNANNTTTYYTYDANELYRLKNISTIDPPQDDTVQTPATDVSTTPLTTDAPAPIAAIPDTTTQQSIPDVQAYGTQTTPTPDVATQTTETTGTKATATQPTTTAVDVQAPAQTASVLQTATDVVEAIQKKALDTVSALLGTEQTTEVKKEELPVLAEDTTPPPAEDPAVVAPDGRTLVEDEHLRTASSETYVVKTEGDVETRITRLYPMPKYTKDEETGEWKDVDESFSTRNGELTIDKGSYELDIPKTDTGELATVTVGKLEVTLESGTQSSVPTETSIEANGAAPDNVAEVEDAVAKDINVKLEADANRITKNVVIENKDALASLKKVDDYYEIPFDLGVPTGTKLFVNGVEITEPTIAERAELRLGDDSLYIMPGQAHDARSNKTGIQFSFSLDKNGIHLVKRIPAEWLEGATYPVKTDAVFATSPDISDGSVYKYVQYGGSWPAVISAASGTTVYSNASTTVQSSGNGDGAGGWAMGNERGFLAFDTSALPDAAQITAAQVKIYVTEFWQSYFYGTPSSFVLTSANKAAPNNLVLNDYASVGSTELSSLIAPPQAYAPNTFIPLTLNTTGLATISTTSWTQFALRTTKDTRNEQPYGTFRMQYAATETPGTAQDPYIEVTYNIVTLPARATALTTDGQANNPQATTQPKFAATYNDTDDVDTSIAYQIQVIKDGGDFATLLWDSGKVSFTTAVAQGARTPDISYGGTALPQDGTKYRWRMKLWDFGNIDGPWTSGSDSFTVTSQVTSQNDLQTDCITAQIGRLDPTGLKCAAPVFAAKYTGTNPVSKYRVQVATDAAFATLVWDSGSAGTPMQTVTTNGRTQDIVYMGAPLTFNGTRYYWRIQYADASNVWSSWSATASFTTFTSRVYQNLSYIYDLTGNPLSVLDGSDLPTAKKLAYSYDALYRILSASATTLANAPIYSTTYTYDTIGNLASNSDVGTYTYAGTGTASPNAPTQVGSSTYTYDAKGNLSSDGTKTLSYFYDNLLSSVVNGGVTTTYNYFADRSRASVLTPALSTYYPNKFFNQDSNGKKVKHIYQNSEDVATVENVGGIVTPYFNHDDALGSSAVSTSNILAYNRPPTISLQGPAAVVIAQNGTFTDLGSKADDTEDGKLTPVVTGTVNTAAAGTYYLTYTATDSGGSTATAMRTVFVQAPNPADTLPTPLVHWKVNGPYNTTAKHSNSGSGTARTLALAGGYTSAAGQAGVADTAISLNGTSNYVTAPAYTPTTNQFVIAAKVKPAAVTATKQMLYYQSNSGTNSDTVALYLLNGKAYCEINGVNTNWSLPAPSGGWNDIVCKKEPTAMYLWLNGTYSGGVGMNPTLPTFTTPLLVGKSLAGEYFGGVIDDIKIYDNYNPSQYDIPYLLAPKSNTAPVLTLNGDTAQVVVQNGTYVEQGATATDAEDGSIIPTISGTINTATLGTQTLTYTATDSGGYAVKQTRSVTIVRPGPLAPNEVEITDYTPYGKVRTTALVGTSGFSEKKRAFGYEYDQSSDLGYASARYYNQNVGQFTSQDPVSLSLGTQQAEQISGRTTQQLLADPQGLNAYSYARNNPLKYTDASGAWFKEFLTGQQSANDFQIEVGDAANQMAQDSAVWRTAMDYPYAPTVIGSAPLTIYGGITLAPQVMTGIRLGTLSQLPALNRVDTIANKGFDAIQKATNLTKTEAVKLIQSTGKSLIDLRNGGNINTITTVGDKAIRMTTNPNATKVISSGVISPATKVAQYISSGAMQPVSTLTSIVQSVTRAITSIFR